MINVDERSRELTKRKNEGKRRNGKQRKKSFQQQEDYPGLTTYNSGRLGSNFVKIHSIKKGILYSIQKLQHLPQHQSNSDLCQCYLCIKSQIKIRTAAIHLLLQLFPEYFLSFLLRLPYLKMSIPYLKNQTVNLPKSCFVFRIPCDENVKRCSRRN